MRRIFSKQNRALISELVRTDFKLRYQGSVLGYAWSLLNPLLIFVILYVVFVKFLKIGDAIPHYPIYLLLGIVIWNFFVEMTMQSTTSLVTRGDLIKKIRIPRWMIVFSSSIGALINLGLNLIVVAVFMIVNKVGILDTLPRIIFPLLEIYMLALGLSLLLSALFVKFRDVSYIWQVILQAGFYVTPIIYPLSRITDATLQKLLMISPMAQAIQNVRYDAITHTATTTSSVFANGYYQFIPIVITVVIFFVGVLYFKSQAKYFAENI
jgi:ABC-2 type transport system permease protein